MVACAVKKKFEVLHIACNGVDCPSKGEMFWLENGYILPEGWLFRQQYCCPGSEIRKGVFCPQHQYLATAPVEKCDVCGFNPEKGK